MIPITDLRSGVTFKINGVPYQVTKYQHVKMGRGNAVIRVGMRNLINGTSEEKSFNSGATVEAITTLKRKMQYLYRDGNSGVFMNPSTYDQIEISGTVLEQAVDFLREGEEVDVLFWERQEREEPLGVELSPNVALTVTEAPPGVKGNSAANIFKEVTLENGLKIKTPLFVKVGDRVKVDTRTGEYVERAGK